jgi:hypothetical protein
MAKCANCASEAFFVYQLTANYGINYCSRHVPKFLQNAKRAGSLVKIEPVSAALVEEAVAAKTTKKKKEAPVVEEPIVELIEEPVVEAPVEEAPIVEEPATEE